MYPMVSKKRISPKSHQKCLIAVKLSQLQILHSLALDILTSYTQETIQTVTTQSGNQLQITALTCIWNA